MTRFFVLTALFFGTVLAAPAMAADQPQICNSASAFRQSAETQRQLAGVAQQAGNEADARERRQHAALLGQSAHDAGAGCRG